MPIKPFPIIGQYDRQQFDQFNPEACSNWYLTTSDNGKKKMAMYPMMGRKHVNYLGDNKLFFASEPRGMFKSVNYAYIVDGSSIYRIDSNFNEVEITEGKVTSITENIYFTYLTVGLITFAVFTDGEHIYVYIEPNPSLASTFNIVTDPHAPSNPLYIATFGNRIVVSQAGTNEATLSIINLGGNGFNPNTCFDNGYPVNTLTLEEDGIINQIGVLRNTLYFYLDFTTSIWSNTPTTLPNGTAFPWKKNTSFNLDYGIADPLSLDIDFNRMVWLAKNSNGLFQVVSSTGGQPEELSTKAISLLFRRNAVTGELSPFQEHNADGFLYIENDTVFYRLSAGDYIQNELIDFPNEGSSVEYNFETKTWGLPIELNGQRGRIQKHVYFNDRHLVSVKDDTTVYEASQQFFINEITNPDQSDHDATDAYIMEPFRYERITPIIAEDDYSEFQTDWVQIDMVWGNQSYFNFITTAPLDINSIFYHAFFKPHVELYFSDDGGMSFKTADVREFSQSGIYSWRMRWYQLGISRNRVYKLVCVSPAPMIILGGTMLTKEVSGGAR